MAASDGRRFGDGRLAVEIDQTTGFPSAWLVDGRPVVAATDACQPFRIQENWYAVTNDGTWRVESVSFATNVLRTVTRAGHWLVGQEITLYPETARARRVFTLEWTSEVPGKLRGFQVDGGTMALGERGAYRLPCVLPVVDVAAANLRPGTENMTYESPFSVVATDGAGRSATWVVDDSRPYCDTGFTRVKERQGAISVTSPFECMGYARRGGRETVGDLWLCFGRHATTEATMRAMPAWFDAVGQRVVAGRPEWIRHGVVYSMHPCGTRGSHWTDWGGFPFSTTQLARIADLGANIVWMMPLESASPYFPVDFYKLSDSVGTEADYRAFVAEAKRCGLRLFRDIVPHGGTDVSPHAKAHPDWVLRSESGSASGTSFGGHPYSGEPDCNYWVFDMGNPEWRNYMSDVAYAYVSDGLDGLRMDASGGSPKPNWSPDIRGRRASMSRRASGSKMQSEIRAGARRANPDSVVLAEGDLSVFATTSDVLYDWSLAFRGLRAFVTSDPEPVVDGVRRYLNDEIYSQVPGHLRLRYQSNHDCLHSSLVYGGAAHLANYALLAWQPGVAFVYQEEELGHTDALREIYRMRREIPELTLGTADYLSEKASPCVYAARFEKDGNTSVVRINFNGVETDGLLPFEYRIERNGTLAFSSAAGRIARLPAAGAPCGAPAATWRFPGAKRWCVLTADGRYEESFCVRHPFYDKDNPFAPWTYHRPHSTDCQFDSRLHPFGFAPECATVAVEDADGVVRVASFESTAHVRLLEDKTRPDELTVATAGGSGEVAFARGEWPAPVAVATGDARLTPGPTLWRYESGDLRVDMARGGALRGVWRKAASGAWRKVCGAGSPRSTAGWGVKRYDAFWECESFARFERVGTAIKVVFEGALRDRERFGLTVSPLPYTMTYVFDGDKTFSVTPSVSIVEYPDRNGGKLFFDLAKGDPDALAPKLTVGDFFGRRAEVTEGGAMLLTASWLDRGVTALKRGERNGFTLRLSFE